MMDEMHLLKLYTLVCLRGSYIKLTCTSNRIYHMRKYWMFIASDYSYSTVNKKHPLLCFASQLVQGMVKRKGITIRIQQCYASEIWFLTLKIRVCGFSLSKKTKTFTFAIDCSSKIFIWIDTQTTVLHWNTCYTAAYLFFQGICSDL